MQPDAELVTGQEDYTATAEALEADIGSNPGYFPVPAAARVLLAQGDFVASPDSPVVSILLVRHQFHPATLCKFISSRSLMALILAAVAKSEPDEA